jgi:hypothetical protein
MKPSRRSFLAGAAALVGASATAPLLASQTPSTSNWDTNATNWVDTTAYNFTPGLFEKLVGRTFSVKDSTRGSLKMTLTRVTAPAASNKSLPAVTGFTLHFQQTSGTWLPQDTYQVSINELGTFPLFIVPATAARPTNYVAVINRI